MRPLQFAFLVAACTIAAASQVIVGKTMSTASPDEAVEVEASSGSSTHLARPPASCDLNNRAGACGISSCAGRVITHNHRRSIRRAALKIATPVGRSPQGSAATLEAKRAIYQRNMGHCSTWRPTTEETR